MSETIVTPVEFGAPPKPVILTDAAAVKVKELLAKEENPEAVSLRVAVQPGGCSGMRYALFFDDRQLEGDWTDTIDGVPVRVDKASAPHLNGTTIDWVDSLQGAGFSIENPNAKQSCACGDSFS